MLLFGLQEAIVLGLVVLWGQSGASRLPPECSCLAPLLRQKLPSKLLGQLLRKLLEWMHCWAQTLARCLTCSLCLMVHPLLQPAWPPASKTIMVFDKCNALFDKFDAIHHMFGGIQDDFEAIWPKIFNKTRPQDASALRAKLEDNAA